MINNIAKKCMMVMCSSGCRFKLVEVMGSYAVFVGNGARIELSGLVTSSIELRIVDDIEKITTAVNYLNEKAEQYEKASLLAGKNCLFVSQEIRKEISFLNNLLQ